MSEISLSAWILIGACIIVEASRELCFKKGAHDSSIIMALKKPLIWLGVFLWAMELLIWVEVLETVPLTVAFPVMSLTYVMVLFGSGWLFKEHINRQHLFGAALITAGAAIVGSTGI